MLNIFGCREKRRGGFTLVELMVAIAIVAILVAVAAPGYYNHMVRSRQSEVIGELMSIKAAQERYFADNGGYAGNIGNLPQYAVSGTYHNGDYDYWVTPTTSGVITSGAVWAWALGDPNRDGVANDKWQVSIDDMSAKPQHVVTAGSEGFSWSSLIQIFE